MTTQMNPPHPTDLDIDIQVARSITEARHRKSKTVRSLSDETGISYPTLCKSLSGDRSLTFNEFRRIARALDVESPLLLPEELTFGKVSE